MQKLLALAAAVGTDVKSLQQGKSSVGHIHDDRYYTKAEVDTRSISDGGDIDGGAAASVYLPSQIIDGGVASG